MKQPIVTSHSKRGLRYGKNPFLEEVSAKTKTGVKRITDKTGTKMMVVSGATGEIVAPAGFWQYQEVDRTQFVKLFFNGVKAFKDLSGAGLKVFELLYLHVQANIGKDEVWLTFLSVDQSVSPISKAVFYRGMKEMLEKEFIAESLSPGMYYLNPDFLWNGDRLAFVKEYRIKGSGTTKRFEDESKQSIPPTS